MNDRSILFLTPYPLNKAPSQRFRVELFLPILKQNGFKFSICPFLNETTWASLYSRGNLLKKGLGITWGFCKRLAQLFYKIPFYKYIFIHREAAPLGPPLFEWIISKVYRKKIIYDFDDAIWIPNTSSANHFINWFKAFWKVKFICRWSYKVVVGNDYLYNYAVRFSKEVIKIPTSIDINNRCDKGRAGNDEGKLAIGWTGSHSTLRYLDEIVPVINDLQKKINFNFLVIADKNPLLPVENFEFIPWKADTETNDLLKFDIGIMPLLPDEWSEGKCGFKLIQYFACGIPAIASPVGVNKVIVDEHVNGFLCSTKDEWKSAMETLLGDANLRQEMGFAGRKKIEQAYSIQSQSGKFLQLFS